MAPIENPPIYVHDSVGDNRELFKVVRLTSEDIDLIYDILAVAEFADSANGNALLDRTQSILETIDNLPRGLSRQLKFFRINIVPTIEEPEREYEPEYEYQDREEPPLDTPSLDTSFHDHEMDID